MGDKTVFPTSNTGVIYNLIPVWNVLISFHCTGSEMERPGRGTSLSTPEGKRCSIGDRCAQ